MSVRNVLVVGAGIAGSTLAYWLARYGIDTTVVERAADQRSSGSPVDVRGPALPVVEQMNLLAPLREAATLARAHHREQQRWPDRLDPLPIQC